MQNLGEPTLEVYFFIKTHKMPSYKKVKRNLISKQLFDNSKYSLKIYIYFYDDDYCQMGCNNQTD